MSCHVITSSDTGTSLPNWNPTEVGPWRGTTLLKEHRGTRQPVMSQHTAMQGTSLLFSQQQGVGHCGDTYVEKKMYCEEITPLNPHDVGPLKQGSSGEGIHVSELKSMPNATSNPGSSNQYNLDNREGRILGTSDDNCKSLSPPLRGHHLSQTQSAQGPVPRVRITSRFKRVWETNVEPNTSRQNTRAHINEDTIQGNNVTTKNQRASQSSSSVKTSNAAQSEKKCSPHWKSQTHRIKPQVAVQYGLGSDALNTMEQTLLDQPEHSIFQGKKLNREEHTTLAKNVRVHQPGPRSSRSRKVLAEIISFTRKSPRKRPHVPVYSNKRVKTKKVSEEQDDVGYRQRCILDLPKKRQLLQRTTPPSLPRTEPNYNNNADIREKQAPIVRGKTRSRTRYYSTVGAVYNPPEPRDYRQPRSWPANIGLIYTNWPRDFTEIEPEPPRPVSDKEISAHHALHYIIAIVAVTAAARRGNGISASEAMVLQYMLCRLGQCFPQDSSSPQEEVNKKQKPFQVYQDVRNSHNIESDDTESLPAVKTNFLETLGLKKSNADNDGASYASATEESWMSMVKAMMLHITGILEGFNSIHAQDAHHESILLQTLTKVLKKLLETISLLYSVVCDTPYEVVEEYVASQTPETILEWIKDMVTDIPST